MVACDLDQADLTASNTDDRLIQRFASVGDQRAWAIRYAVGTRTITLTTYATGTTSATTRTSGAVPAGATAVRVDADATAVSFWYSSTPFTPGMDIASGMTWTQIGTSQSGVTIFATSTAGINIGAVDAGTIFGRRTRYDAVVVENAASGGSVIASMDFSEWPTGLTSTTDPHGRTVTLSGTAYLTRVGQSLGAAGPRFGDTAARNYLNGVSFAGASVATVARSASGVDTVERWARIDDEWTLVSTIATDSTGVRLARPSSVGALTSWNRINDYTSFTDYDADRATAWV